MYLVEKRRSRRRRDWKRSRKEKGIGGEGHTNALYSRPRTAPWI